MKWPWVSRRLHEEVVSLFHDQFTLVRDERDEWKRVALLLVDRVVTMRYDGFAVTKPAKIGAPPPEPEVEGLRRAEMAARKSHFISRVTADLAQRNPRLTAVQLGREAEKLWEQTTMQDAPG